MPEIPTSEINMTPMFVFPVLIVIFIAFVHLISDDTINAINKAGNRLIKIAPYLVALSLLLFVVNCIHGRDFIFFLPNYWFHFYLDIFDLILFVLQLMVAFLIGLTIFCIGGFSQDKYVDVTYDKSSIYGDIEIKRSDAYIGRLQFYLMALLGAAIGILMSYTAITIVVFVLFFTFFISGKFKIKSCTEDKQAFKTARRRHTRNRIIISTVFAIIAAAGVTLGTLYNDYRLEKASDIMSYQINKRNQDDFISYEIGTNHRAYYNDIHYGVNIGLDIKPLKSAYLLTDITMKVMIEYQKMSTIDGSIIGELSYEETLNFSRIGEPLFHILIDETSNMVAIITSQNIEFLEAKAICRYNITKGTSYRKVGTKDTDALFIVEGSQMYEQEVYLSIHFNNNTYIKKMDIELKDDNGNSLFYRIVDEFCLKDQYLKLDKSEQTDAFLGFQVDFLKGYVIEFYGA